MGLTNHGSVDVRIEAFPQTGYGFWGLDHVVVADDEDDEYFPEGERPFRPFTLRAGETRRLRADFRFADCGPGAYFDLSHSTIRSLPVRYRILGITRTTSVEFTDAALTSQTLVGECAHLIEDPEGGFS